MKTYSETVAACLWALIAFLIAGCAQYDRSVGEGLVDSDLRGVLHEETYDVQHSATMTIGDHYKSSPANLPLGSQEGISSDVIVTFADFEALRDTNITCSSAQLRLYGNGYVDSTNLEEFISWDAIVYRIDSEWDPLEVIWEDQLELMALDTVEFGTVDKFDSVSVVLDSLTLNRWIEGDSTAVEGDTTGLMEWVSLAHGLRIVPMANSNFLKNFASRQSTNPDRLPILLVECNNTDIDSAFTDTIYSDYTTFLVNDTLALPPDRLYLSDGFARAMLLWTNLDSLLPDDISLNKVELIIHTDPEAEGSIGETDVFKPYDIIEDWFDQPDSAKLGEASIKFYSLESDSQVVRLDVTAPARYWLVNPDENFGVAVRSTNDRLNIGRRGFYDHSADEGLRPRFRIVYTGFE